MKRHEGVTHDYKNIQPQQSDRYLVKNFQIPQQNPLSLWLLKNRLENEAKEHSFSTI